MILSLVSCRISEQLDNVLVSSFGDLSFSSLNSEEECLPLIYSEETGIPSLSVRVAMQNTFGQEVNMP